MQETANFQLHFLREEQHLMMPTVTSIIVTQNLYDILFQYAIDVDYEKKLEHFIKLMETHIKSKSRGPFSMPLTELEFLEDGLEELKLLNWIHLPVTVFEVIIEGITPEQDTYEDELETVLNQLEKLITFNRKDKTNQIFVYPMGLPRY